MAGLSHYYANLVLQHLLKRQALPTPPTTIWYSLHYSDPQGQGLFELHTTNGVTGYSPGYTRVQYVTDVNASTHTRYTDVEAGQPTTARRIRNLFDIVFGAATGHWNQVAAGGAARPIPFFGMFDAITGNINLGAGQPTVNSYGEGYISPVETGITVADTQDGVLKAGQVNHQID